MHKAIIDARWDEIDPEWFDVGCENCKFSSVGHATFEDATRMAEGHERMAEAYESATTPAWIWRWHG